MRDCNTKVSLSPWRTIVTIVLLSVDQLGLAFSHLESHSHVNEIFFKLPSEMRHMGDLHITRGTNVHSLVWVIEINGSCLIKDVVGNIKRKKHLEKLLDIKRRKTDHIIQSNAKNIRKFKLRMKSSGTINPFYPFNNYQIVFNNSSHFSVCETEILCTVILLKKVKKFNNMYLVAHPYFRLYHKVQKNRITHYRRRLLNINYNLDSQFQSKWANSNSMFVAIERCFEKYLRTHPCIKYVQQEVLRSRTKRRLSLEFQDPLYKEQWHLKNSIKGQYDINVVPVWESGITGQGITVCVIDDGLEWQHPDIRDNYSPSGSYDLNANDPDPSPLKNGDRNEHGTRCAGEIAAVANSVCGVGVAYRANISGIRVLGGRMTDSMEAAAFTQGLDVNDIYSCSWGPDDDGKTVDGPHHLASRALVYGITYGRKGYGAIYVVASGNGGKNKDNCNFDGYANSIYTITIGAVDSTGLMPYYAEECAAMLAVTPSSDSNGRDIVTTDWREINEGGCTKHHSGTSAAAPLAAGVVALALEVQPCLSWRDVQYLIALTSRKIDTANSDWFNNSAGLHHSHQHGFGLIDAAAMVAGASVWDPLPFATSYTSPLKEENLQIPPGHLGELTVTHEVSDALLQRFALDTLETVQVYITIEHDYRGSLKILLVCPSGTRSTLATPRDADNSTVGFIDWPLSTVRCWGEKAAGLYRLSIIQTRHQKLNGGLISWKLILHGSQITSLDLKHRLNLVAQAVKAGVIVSNISRPCPLPELRFEAYRPIADQWLKALALTGIFFFLMVICSTFEYIFCYEDEKAKLYKNLKALSSEGSEEAVGQVQTANSVVMAGSCSDHQYGAILNQEQLQGQQIYRILSESIPLMLLAGDSSSMQSSETDLSSFVSNSHDSENNPSENNNETTIPVELTNTNQLSELNENE